MSHALAALFVRSVANATREGPTLLSRLVKLVVRFGQHTNSRWLTLLSKLMVVDGQPIKKNQTKVGGFAA